MLTRRCSGVQEALPGVPGQPDQQPLHRPRPPLQLQRAAAGLQEVQGGGRPAGRGGQRHLLQPAAPGQWGGVTRECLYNNQSPPGGQERECSFNT